MPHHHLWVSREALEAMRASVEKLKGVQIFEAVAEAIGWPSGSPFQLEMGFANLAMGVLRGTTGAGVGIGLGMCMAFDQPLIDPVFGLVGGIFLGWVQYRRSPAASCVE